MNKVKSPKKETLKNVPLASKPKSFSNLHRIIIILLVALCYGNTLTLDFALDDRMVIMESKYTIQGGKEGLKAIFTEDTFNGYFGNGKKNNVVEGGRYRPMSQMTLMFEFQMFGKDIKRKIGDVNDFMNLHNPDHEQFFVDSSLPMICHFFNILYFTLLCLVIYRVLTIIFAQYKGEKWFQSLAFIATVLFVVHPIHTEAVANVKGRDEIFAMLGSMLSLLFVLKFVDTRKWWFLLLSFMAFLFGIFSKENTITFLAVVPLTLYFYNNEHKKKYDYWVTLIPLLLGSVIFLMARAAALGAFMPADKSGIILNNPYVNSTKMEEIATVLLTWAIYLKLLVFPHPLTHDYYPMQIAITNFSNPLVWIVILGSVALIAFALWKLRKRHVVAFGILFFIITFSVTSNLLFNIGTFMNERFVFIPSLGFTLILGYGFYLLFMMEKKVIQHGSLVVLMIICALLSLKTITRNKAWKDDFTLFLTDVKTSTNSIKCNISAGGSYLQMYKKSQNKEEERLAYQHLYKALSLDSTALNAYLLLGELQYLDDSIEAAYQSYLTAEKVAPDNFMAKDNVKKMAFLLEDKKLKPISSLLDQAFAEQSPAKVQQVYTQITQYLEENPESIIALNIKGNTLGRGMGRLDEAISIYQQIIQKDPTFASAYENMGIAYAIKRDFAKAEECLLNAQRLVPDNENVKKNLYSLYMDMGDQAKAEAMMNR